jgi:hypothetical protein
MIAESLLSIFNQRENPAVHGGRESRPFRDATAASGTAGTPTETAKSSANVCFDRVTPHPIANERGMWAALHPCLRRAGSPVDGLWPTRCEPCRHRTARFDRLGESGRLKIDRDDTLSDGSARDSATRRSRPRVETRPIDAGRASLETEPDDRVPRCGREAPPFTAGEDVTPGFSLFLELLYLLYVFKRGPFFAPSPSTF